MAVKGTIQFQFDFPDLTRKIRREQKRILVQSFARNKTKIEEDLKNEFSYAVQDSAVFRSIKDDSGVLRRQLGIEHNQGDLFNILQKLLSGVRVEVGRAIGATDSESSTIPVKFFLLNKNLNDVLESPSASYTSYSIARKTAIEIHWLEWLLTRGSETVVAGFHVWFKDWPLSRTVNALMEPTGTYEIPDYFAGVKDDNFITQAAQKASEKLSDIVLKNIQ